MLELLEKYSEQLKLLFGLDIEHVSNYRSYARPDTISNLKWVDGHGDLFCFHLDLDLLKITAPHDRLTIGMNIAFYKHLDRSTVCTSKD